MMKVHEEAEMTDLMQLFNPNISRDIDRLSFELQVLSSEKVLKTINVRRSEVILADISRKRLVELGITLRMMKNFI